MAKKPTPKPKAPKRKRQTLKEVKAKLEGLEEVPSNAQKRWNPTKDDIEIYSRGQEDNIDKFPKAKVDGELIVTTKDGEPKRLNKDGSVDRRGGKMPGCGAPTMKSKLANYKNGIRMLDDNIEDALQVLIDWLSDEDKFFRLKCAELLLKKTIPDKKTLDIGVKGGGVSGDGVDIGKAISDINTMIKNKRDGADSEVVEAEYEVESEE